VTESFFDWFATAFDSNAERTALVYRGEALRYGELRSRALEFAGRLSADGVRAGDRVALCIECRVSFVTALLGGFALGATVAPLDPLLAPAELAEIAADLDPVRLVDAAPDLSGSGATPRFETRGRAGPPLVLYTSGSTGRPKGAILSGCALRSALELWAGPVLELGCDDVVLSALPLEHSFGLNAALLAPLLRGASVVLLERPSPEAVLEAVSAHRVTVLPAVPTLIRRLLDAAAFSAAAFASLRLAVTGAAPCAWELAREWRERAGVRLLRGYGMTELFRPISYRASDASEVPDSVGRALPGVEVRVLDDSGALLAPGAVGELWVRSPAVMDGYWNCPEETAEVIRDSWFRTGDLASIDRDGFVRIAGRRRERILRGGSSIFPAEVEAVLGAHPAVAEAAVVGRADRELGEEIEAFVALRPGARAGPAELVEHCRARLARFKWPRRVTVVDRLPRGPGGKVIKDALT
jgi:long-chain acyl-CoA synthetase